MKSVEINEQTKIPLGFLIGGLSLILMFSAWLTTLHRDVAEARESVSEIRIDQKEELKLKQQINYRLHRIEFKLGIDEPPKENN